MGRFTLGKYIQGTLWNGIHTATHHTVSDLGNAAKNFQAEVYVISRCARLFYRRTIMVNVLSFSVTVKRHFSQFHPLLGALLILFVSTGLNEMLC